jgi:hypothetical protein
MTPQAWRMVKRTTELLSLLSIAISLPVGLYQLKKEARKERQLLVEKAYDDLDQRYIDFQKLCLQYPDFDIYDKPATNPPALAEPKITQQKLLYTIVLSMLERAFLTFESEEMPSRRHQWKGWDEYADSFMSRVAFQRVWDEVGTEYDSRFQAYMNKKKKR